MNPTTGSASLTRKRSWTHKLKEAFQHRKTPSAAGSSRGPPSPGDASSSSAASSFGQHGPVTSFSSEPPPVTTPLLDIDSASRVSSKSLVSQSDDATLLSRPSTTDFPVSGPVSPSLADEIIYPEAQADGAETGTASSLGRRGATRKLGLAVPGQHQRSASAEAAAAAAQRSPSPSPSDNEERQGSEVGQEEEMDFESRWNDGSGPPPPSFSAPLPSGVAPVSTVDEEPRAATMSAFGRRGLTARLRGTKHAEQLAPLATESLRTKSYGMLLPTELSLMQTEAATTLDRILQSSVSTGPDRLTRKHVRTPSERESEGELKRWFSAIIRKKQAETVTNVPIQKSVAYASVTLSNTVNPACRVPIIIYECCRYIREYGAQVEGIFRISGSERRVAVKYPEFDQPPNYGLNTSWDGYTIHDVAHILKKYLREIPEPLFTHDLYPYFMQILDVSTDDTVRAKYTQCLVCLLPPAHLVSVEFLFDLLVEISRNADRTQMTNSNLARVLAPTILRQANKESGSGVSIALGMSITGSQQDLSGLGLPELELAAQVVEFMLDTYHRWGHLTSPLTRPFVMLSSETMGPYEELEQAQASPVASSGGGELDAGDLRTSFDSYRRGDDSPAQYAPRRSFSFTSTGDSVQQVPAYFSPSAESTSSRTALRTPTAGSGSLGLSPAINLTLTVQTAGMDRAMTVPIEAVPASPVSSSPVEEEMKAWPEGAQGVRRSRTAPVKRGRGRGSGEFRWFAIEAPLSLTSYSRVFTKQVQNLRLLPRRSKARPTAPRQT